MRLVITIIALVAYFLFKGVGSAIGRNANVPMPVNQDEFESEDVELEEEDVPGSQISSAETVPSVPSAEAMAALKAELMAKHAAKMKELARQKQAAAAAVKPAAAPKPKPAAPVEPEKQGFVIDDPKKLILYSEIMKPKFDE